MQTQHTSSTALPRRDRTRTSALSLAALATAIAAPLAAADPVPPDFAEQRAAVEAKREAMRADGFVTKNEIGAGALLIASTEPGLYVEAPLVAANVDMDIAGPIIRTKLTQRFTNPTDKWVEGVYAFPLPEDAAVDTLKIIIGDRFIEGEIKERAEARRIYEQAVRDGLRAGLVEQERPNLFTTSVANIGPGETVAIQIEYQDKARIEDGKYSTRFPMVVAPRYNPEPQIALTADRNGFVSVSDPVPDRDRISPPVLHPSHEPAGVEGLRLPVSFDIAIDAGMPVNAVKSRTHDLVQFTDRSGAVHASLRNDEVAADRDFVLEWTPDTGAQPVASIFSQQRDGDTYYLATITPPSLSAAPIRRDRETVFVIDNSGSMSGPSMDQAKEGLLIALDRLVESDEFNIIRFDDTMDLLFQTAVPATPQNIARAKRFVRNLEANGGTEMLPALRAALVDADPRDTDELRQVVFITDGAIGNETQLFDAIANNLGRSRLFTVGIGSAPNSYFMTRAARLGRGTFTYIDDVNEVADQSAKLFAALENPVMTDIRVTLPDGAAIAYPSPVPDLYAGEPVQVAIQTPNSDGDLTISGSLNGQSWTQTLSLESAHDASGVAQLWGRAQIAAIEESRYAGASMAAVDAGVLRTALDFNLVSRLTSLVAVDVTPARPAGEPLTTRQVATMLPAGWDFAAVFGDKAEARARRFDRLPENVMQAINARATRDQPTDEAKESLDLPATAANWKLLLAFGLFLTSFGAVILGRGRLTALQRAVSRRPAAR